MLALVLGLCAPGVGAQEAAPAQGDDPSQAALQLGVRYYQGDGVPKDRKLAITWLRRAADKGNAKGQFLLSVLLLGDENPQVKAEGMDWLRKAAAQKYPAALTEMGIKAFNGQDGVRKDEPAALQWFTQAANLGDGDGQYFLALMIEDGLSVQKDAKVALQWMQLAAEAGSDRAQALLGSRYLDGERLPKDMARGVELMRKAAEQDNVRAMAVLGSLYVQGKGVPKDERVAFDWVTKAAAGGDAHDLMVLSAYYWDGTGTPKDHVKSMSLLRKAAVMGDPMAQLRLGRAYANGHGGAPKNGEQAEYWIRRAADQGEEEAQAIMTRVLDERAKTAKKAREILK